MSEEVLLTKEGYQKIEIELETLVTVKRKEVAERMKEAISYGDISENSEYDSAKNDQAELEARIAVLEHKLRKAKIINEDEISVECVNIGLKVDLQNTKTKEIETFSIVGSTEADPFEGKISNESPVGSALIGKKLKAKIEVPIPDGVVKYQIVKIYK